MCGIIGYTGVGKAQDIMLEGLSKLEYRGYDSAGIAYFSKNNKISIRKTVGKVKDLIAICEEDNEASTGIGHNRWATHGGVTNRNAHPHKAGKIVLIHNGIIENYHELEKEYALQEELLSETDSEIAAAVLNKMYDGDPIKSIKKFVKKLKGTYAFCILFQDHPGKIFCTRKVSPMVAAHFKTGAFVSSDLTAFLKYGKEYFVVPEDCIMTMRDHEVLLEDFYGNQITPAYLTVDWDIFAAQKNGYPHYMIKEIKEQPDVIRRTILPRIVEGLPDFTVDEIPTDFFQHISDITVIGCGTAYYAGMAGKTLIQEKLGIPVQVEIASEFRYARPTITKNTLVIAISQSGETIDTLEALRLAKKYTNKTIAVVNVKGSSIARESHKVLYTHAGPEIAVASTKAYTVQVSIFYLLVCKLGMVQNKIAREDAVSFIEHLNTVSNKIEQVFEQEPIIRQITKRIAQTTDLFFIGRGSDYTLSMEGALKCKEVSYIHAEAYAAGELKHGTLALIHEGVPVIALATQEKVYGKVISNIREVKARGAFVILISKGKESAAASVCDLQITLPEIEDTFAIFPAVTLLQILAYYTSVERGLNPDQPRNLAKSVTVE